MVFTPPRYAGLAGGAPPRSSRGGDNSMEFHTDRRLNVVSDTKHKNLYAWCINEIDENCKIIAEDYIPWIRSLCFSVSRIFIYEELKIEEPYNGNYNLYQNEISTLKNYEHRVRDGRRIRAKLYPGLCNDEGAIEDSVSFRMFGCDRLVKTFDLTIHPMGEGEGIESCSAWGWVSSASEDGNFIDQTQPDEIGFDLRVKSSTFERYIERISSGMADEIVFRVGHVAGFYSRWSPSISTNEIKVLTRHEKEHKLQMPADMKFEPPRLGSIGESSLLIKATRITRSGRLRSDPERY